MVDRQVNSKWLNKKNGKEVEGIEEKSINLYKNLLRLNCKTDVTTEQSIERRKNHRRNPTHYMYESNTNSIRRKYTILC